MNSQVLVSIDNKIATLTLNRPDKLNAFTTEFIEELVAALSACDDDDNVSVVILTGAGRVFSAGADLEYFSSPDAQFDLPAIQGADGTANYSAQAIRDQGGLITLQMFKMKKPLIAAVNGHAVGMAASMLLPMDIRIAAEQAKFAFPFVRRGICAESQVSFFLSRLVGSGVAADWLLTGRTFTAGEAFGAGMLHQLCAPDEVLPEAYRRARDIADNTAPVSVALTRQMLWQGLGWSHPMEAHRWESRGMFTRLIDGADAAEGTDAFLHKRKPNFPDKVSSDMPDFYPWWSEPDYQ